MLLIPHFQDPLVFMFRHYIFSTTTKEQFDFIDLTNLAQKIVQESKIKNGLLNIQSLHTTVAIIVNENEPLLISDMKKNARSSNPSKYSIPA